MTETSRRRARRFLVAAAACAAVAPTSTRPRRPGSAVADRGRDADARLGPGGPGPGARRGEGARRRRDPRQRDLVALRAVRRTPRRSPSASTARTRPPIPPARSAMLDSIVAGAQARGMEVLLTADRPDPGVGLEVQAGSRRDAAHLQARLQALRRVRPCTRHALPDRQEMVDLERAEPALVAEPAVRDLRLAGRAALRVTCTAQLATSAIAGLRATGHRADQIWLGETAPLGDDPSGCSAQRSLRVPKKCAAQDPQDLAGDVPARRVLPQHQGQEADRRGGVRPAVRRLQEAQRDRLRAPSVHARRLAPAAPRASTRARSRSTSPRASRACSTTPPRPSGSRPSCRSTTPSTAGRPSRT